MTVPPKVQKQLGYPLRDPIPLWESFRSRASSLSDVFDLSRLGLFRNFVLDLCASSVVEKAT